MNDNVPEGAPAPESPHDPLARKEADEPHFVLLARDPRAAHQTRLYAALREQKFAAADAIYANLKKLCAKLPLHPKDRDHAWSARAVATDMDIWRYDNVVKHHAPETKGEEVTALHRSTYADLTPDDAGALTREIQIAAIKRARPPTEPDEAS